MWEELSHGRVEPSSREAARRMLAELEREGVEAVILGCTELAMLIETSDTPLPLYDTTLIASDSRPNKDGRGRRNLGLAQHVVEFEHGHLSGLVAACDLYDDGMHHRHQCYTFTEKCRGNSRPS